MNEAGKTNELEVAIFSYNKGKYLKNCIESVYQNLPDALITVFDDDSDDAETVEYLKSLGDIVVTSRSQNTARHGNLYKNMQKALDRSSKRFILFLQDDIQLVRAVTKTDIENIVRVFEDDKVAFLRPHFFPNSIGMRLAASPRMSPIPKSRIYVPNAEKGNAPTVYSFYDIVICDTLKLKTISWQFCEGERNNQRQARANFKYLPVLADSFISFCPEVPTYRHKKMMLASRIAQRKLNGKISALQVMSEVQNADFTTRDINIWPIAEDFLEATNPNVLKPFHLVDYRRSKFLLMLYKLENTTIKMILAIRSFIK